MSAQGTTGTTGTTENTSGQAASDAGKGVGNIFKNAFGAVHGIGEVIRGNFNNAVDGAGEAVAGRKGANEAVGHNAEDGAAVANKGQTELQSSIEGFKQPTENQTK